MKRLDNHVPRAILFGLLLWGLIMSCLFDLNAPLSDEGFLWLMGGWGVTAAVLWILDPFIFRP